LTILFLSLTRRGKNT